MRTARKTAKTTVKRTASEASQKRMAAAAVPKTATKASADPTGQVMTRLRGSLGKDYRLDI